MDFRFFDLGLIAYDDALARQKELFAEVYRGALDSALIVCRHYPVITLGRQATPASLRVSESELKRKGIGLYKTERGGDITYHGPGQLVFYPVLRLDNFGRDIRLFLRYLEEFAVNLLQDFGIKAERREGFTGVWWKGAKIASIGIAIRKWITFHGLALNVKADDLENFSLIRPCGMDIKMTSVESVLGTSIAIEKLGTPFLLKLRVSLKGDSLPIGTKGVPR